VELSPSLLTRLRHESISHAILTQFMTPGLWIVSQTNATGSVAASLATPSILSAVPTYPEDGASKNNSNNSSSSSPTTIMTVPNHQALVRISQQLSLQFEHGSVSIHRIVKPTHFVELT
jgi:hypothetical protein